MLSATDMRPGAPPTTGTVDIANSGSIAGRFTLSRDRLSSSDGGAANPAPFADKVVLTVTDCGRFAGGSAPACGDSDDVVYRSGTRQMKTTKKKPPSRRKKQ